MVKKIAEGSFGFVYLAKDMKPIVKTSTDSVTVPVHEDKDVIMNDVVAAPDGASFLSGAGEVAVETNATVNAPVALAETESQVYGQSNLDFPLVAIKKQKVNIGEKKKEIE